MIKTLGSKEIRKCRTAVFKSYVVFAACIFIFLAFYANLFSYFPFDPIITKGIQHFNPVWFDTTMKWISFPGSNPQVILIIALIAMFLFFGKLRWESILCVFSATLATTVGIVIKNIVHRPRPSADMINVLKNLQNSSFPS
jgi:hypothetical protein